MNIADISPRQDADYGAERMFICGESGRGKSRLTKRIVEALPPMRDKRGHTHDLLVVVVDSKHDWPFARLPRLGKGDGKPRWQRLPFTDLRLVPPGFYIYRPSTYPESGDAGSQKIFLTALKRQFCVVVIDEAGDYSHGRSAAALGKLIRQGRAKNVIVMCGTQRPTGVVLLAITEAVILICFHLGSADDYDRLAKWGNPAFAEPPDGEYDFNLFNRRKKRFIRVRQSQEAV